MSGSNNGFADGLFQLVIPVLVTAISAIVFAWLVSILFGELAQAWARWRRPARSAEPASPPYKRFDQLVRESWDVSAETAVSDADDQMGAWLSAQVDIADRSLASEATQALEWAGPQILNERQFRLRLVWDRTAGIQTLTLTGLSTEAPVRIVQEQFPVDDLSYGAALTLGTAVMASLCLAYGPCGSATSSVQES